jgi:hypothetical protein
MHSVTIVDLLEVGLLVAVGEEVGDEVVGLVVVGEEVGPAVVVVAVN